MRTRLALSTLLLAAAVIAQPPLRSLESRGDTVQRELPPYVTYITKGDPRVPLRSMDTYKIPDGQQTGEIYPINRGQCPGQSIRRVDIYMYDWAPGGSGSISDDLNTAELRRAYPYENDAVIYLWVGCV